MNVLLARLLGVLLLVCGVAHAHTGSSSFVMLREQGGGNIAADMDFALRDLNQIVPLDANLDGVLTWAEVERAQSAIESSITARTQLSLDGRPCDASHAAPIAIAQHGDGPYARVSLLYRCQSAAAALQLDHAGWFAFDANHRGLLEYTTQDGGTAQAILTQQQPQWRATVTRSHRVAEFLIEGTRHLLTGYDHLAFLGVLLLGLIRRRESTRPVALRVSIQGALTVITAFTVAHSLTLGLAATGHLTLPSQLVEIAIAASVLCAALLNLGRGGANHCWKLAFGFGLVHGLGFAGALAELAGAQLDWLALAAFNIGIELAQIAIAALALPLLWLLFRDARTERVGVPLIACSVAGLAAVWIATRAGLTL